MLLTGEVGVNQLSGPVGIVDVVNDTYDEAAPSGWSAVILSMMNLGILISANLGVMNLLPIPALDGGRLVFLLIEAVRRKRIAPEKEGMVHFIGFAALMALMVFVMYNDIMRLFDQKEYSIKKRFCESRSVFSIIRCPLFFMNTLHIVRRNCEKGKWIWITVEIKGGTHRPSECSRST